MNLATYCFRNLLIKSLVFLLFSALLLSNTTHAYEGLSKNPGTRAMGMAGVFSAQADDSSAIWYNPGAIAFYDYIKTDLTFEIGQRPVSGENINSETHNIYANTGDEYTLNFLAAYTRKIPFLRNNKSIGLGFSYFKPYQLRIDVETPRSNIDETSFGYIEVRYHQVSALLSAHPLKKLSLGATFDFLWTDIKCLQFQPCVKTGPTAMGAKVGALYQVIDYKSYTLKLSSVWHSKASTQYISTPKSGIGTVLNDYLPNRPELFGFGASIQKPTPWMLITSNLSYEIVSWAASISKGKPLTDYHNIGLSLEFMSNINNGNSISLRCGSKLLQSRESISPDVLVNAIGFGYEFMKSHIIDIAVEHRRFNGISENSNFVSMSYAWQKSS